MRVADWRAQLRRDLRKAVEAAGLLEPLARRAPSSPYTLHLAIFEEPYLEWILNGRKTIESRFSVHRVAPYGIVDPGDWLVLKRTSGPVLGLCRVTEVEFFELDSQTRERLRNKYSGPLCANDPAFWDARERSCFATMMHVGEVYRLPPVSCAKRDRRGWVVLPDLTAGGQLVFPGSWARRTDWQREV